MATEVLPNQPTQLPKARKRRGDGGYWLALPAAFWLVVFFLAPLLMVLVVSFWERGLRGALIPAWTLENYHYVDERYTPILERSLEIAGYTTLICLLLGYPLAFYISTRTRTWVRNLSLFLVILPFWTNFLIRTYAWRVLLGDSGVLNSLLINWGLRSEPLNILFTEKAVIVGMVYGFLPFMVLPIYASIERFDFKLVEAAHDLGANDWTAFWRIIFPITLPGVVAGIILVFIPSVGAFITPDLLGGRRGLMIGNLIQRNFRGTGHWPRGSAASIALMAIVMAGLAIYLLSQAREQRTRTKVAKMDATSVAAQPTFSLAMVWDTVWVPFDWLGDQFSRLWTWLNSQFDLGDSWRRLRDQTIRWVGKLGLWITPVINYAFLWLPIAILVLFSFNDSRSTGAWRGFTTRWYVNIANNVVGEEARFSTDQMLNSLQNSLIVSVSATLIATVIGTLVALALVRSQFRGKNALNGLLYLPVAIPEITQGISLLLFFNLAFDFINEHLGFTNLNFGYMTIIIAHVAFNISFVTIVVRARLADMNPRFEEAARDLGANEWRTFWRVTFPLILPGVLAGALLAFTLSLDDFVVTFFTSGVGTTTLTVFVYGLLKLSVTPEINAVSTLMIIVSTLLVGLSLVLQGRNASRA